MEKALIFGSGGQDGYYLSKLLVKNSINVIGVSRSKQSDIIGNVADYELVSRLIKNEKPNFIFHLAANSTANHNALWDNHLAISTGTLNILEAVYKFSRGSKVFLSGSGLQFENKNLPIDESGELASSSPYAISRNHSLFAGRYYRSLGLKVYFGFFFNHDSPRRPVRHLAQKVAYYCRTLSNQHQKLIIGNLDTRKEWTFAGDITSAIWLIVNQDNIFEIVIGSGKDYPIRDWVDICFSSIGKDWRQYVETNDEFVPEYNTLVSNPYRLLKLGWSPEVGIEKLAEMMINNRLVESKV